MNGSKNILLLLIFLMALLPWGFLVVLLTSEKGAELLGIETGATVPAGEVEKLQTLVQEQEAEMADMRTRLASTEATATEPLITPEALAGLNASLEQLRTENREARAEIDRLRTEYNSALSEVVRLKTQQMAAEAVPTTPAQPTTPSTPASERSTDRTPPADPGGWILPPSN